MSIIDVPSDADPGSGPDHHLVATSASGLPPDLDEAGDAQVRRLHEAERIANDYHPRTRC